MSEPMNSAASCLSYLRKTFTPKNLRHILPVHEHVGQKTIVDISAVWLDANRATAKEFF